MMDDIRNVHMADLRNARDPDAFDPDRVVKIGATVVAICVAVTLMLALEVIKR